MVSETRKFGEKLNTAVTGAEKNKRGFEAIEIQFGLAEKEVAELMRKEMKSSSFKIWCKRMNGRQTKHAALRSSDVNRFKYSRQKTISLNKISKK